MWRKKVKIRVRKDEIYPVFFEDDHIPVTVELDVPEELWDYYIQKRTELLSILEEIDDYYFKALEN